MPENLEKHLRNEMLRFDKRRELFLKELFSILEGTGCYVDSVQNGVATIVTQTKWNSRLILNMVRKSLKAAPLDYMPERFVIKNKINGHTFDVSIEFLGLINGAFHRNEPLK